MVAVGLLAAGCGLRDAEGDPLIVAHRGGADVFPENGLRAVEGSIERGWEGIEVDVVLTRDGVPVLWHDPWVDGTLCRRVGGEELPAGERLLFRDMDLASLRAELECGGKPHPDGAHPDAERVWAPIATLEEALILLREAPGLTVQLDVKYEPGFTEGADRFADEILGVWHAQDMPNPVYASATHPELLRALRERMPQLETTLIWPRFSEKLDGQADVSVAIRNELAVTTGVQSQAARIGEGDANGIAIAWQVANRHEVQALRDEGFRVQLWTVGSPERLEAYCRWPVNALITDNPEEAPCR